PPMRTVADPMTMASAPQLSPMRAAGSPPISTVGAPGGMMGVGTPMVAVLTIMSVTRAAGGIASSSLLFRTVRSQSAGTGLGGSSVDLHGRTADHERAGARDFRIARARRLESCLRAEFRIVSGQIQVLGCLEYQVLGTFDRDAAVIERD